MYSDGGYHPEPARPVFGEVTIRRAGSPLVVARPTQDARGDFRVDLAPGRYEVRGKPEGWPFGSWGTLVEVVVVRSGTTSTADLGLHMF